MEKFYLSDENLNKINIFLNNKKNNILLISGKSGCGKTELANEIFKKISMVINTTSIKKYKNIDDELLNSLKKKNIMIMFQEKKENKEILIDDFDVLYKHDKKLFNGLINFLMNKKFYNSKFIIIINNSFINNRSLKKLDYLLLNLDYTLTNYYSIVTKIFKDKNINKDSNELDQIIFQSNYNLNKIYSLLNYSKNENNILNDNYDTNTCSTNKILFNNLTINEIFTMYDSFNDSSISLNLLENILLIFKKDKDIFHKITKIYEYYKLYDYFETKMIKYHFWELKNYNILFTLCIFSSSIDNQLINNNKTDILNNFIYNKYISKSIYTTNINNIYNENILNNHYNHVYFYLYLIYICNVDKDILIDKLKKINKKYLNNIIKSFEKNETLNYKIKIIV